MRGVPRAKQPKWIMKNGAYVRNPNYTPGNSQRTWDVTLRFEDHHGAVLVEGHRTVLTARADNALNRAVSQAYWRLRYGEEYPNGQWWQRKGKAKRKPVRVGKITATVTFRKDGKKEAATWKAMQRAVTTE